jgi:hypothetical protein
MFIKSGEGCNAIQLAGAGKGTSVALNYIKFFGELEILCISPLL